MRTILLITFFLAVCLACCRNKNCEIEDYGAIQWQMIDSATSFYLCSTSDVKLTEQDYVEVECLGQLQNETDVVALTEADKEMLAMLTGAGSGRFKITDTNLLRDTRPIIPALTKNSTALIKYDLKKMERLVPQRKITVYFNSGIDSAGATKWISEIKTRPYIDSIIYFSKDAALRKWGQGADSSWKAILEENPLPSSVEIFIRKEFFTTDFIEHLKPELMRTGMISEVTYPGGTIMEGLNKFKEMLNNIYLVRLKT